jgi:hypothetical protein
MEIAHLQVKSKNKERKAKLFDGNHKTIFWQCYESLKIRHHKKLITDEYKNKMRHYAEVTIRGQG